MADVNPPLEERIVHVMEAQRESYINHYHEPKEFGFGIEIAKRAGRLASAGHESCLAAVS